MIGFVSLLILAAAPDSEPHPVAELQEARNATHRLDKCLQQAAKRLSGRRLNWPEKYDAYFQSCPTERRIMFQKMFAAEWAYHQPRNQSERVKTYEIAKTRVEDRYDIWTKILDPGPIMS